MSTRLHQLVQSSDLSPITKRLYLASVDEWIKFAGPNPNDWTPVRAQAFYEDLLLRMKPQSANRVIAGVSHASSWLAKTAQRPELHFCIVQKRKNTAKASTESLSWEDASLLLNTTEGDNPINIRDRALIVLGLETGMRAKSLEDARMDQVRIERGMRVIHVKVKGSRDERKPVPLSDTATLALETWGRWMQQHRAGKGYLFQTLTKRIEGNKLSYQVSNTHAPLTTAAIYSIVRGRGATIGLKLHPHMFRSTFVTWRIADGYAPHEIAAMTWHSMNLGAMGTYIDRGVIGEKIRNSTPPWLAEVVRRLCS